MADDCIHAAQGKGAVPMGSAIYRSFISVYFLTVQTYERMRLITRVYSMLITILQKKKSKLLVGIYRVIYQSSDIIESRTCGFRRVWSEIQPW